MDQEVLQVGQTFADRYRVEKFLAKGGFGAVYAAEQIETELKVALKVLWPHVLHSQDAVEKFRLEARVAGRVGSEHIVKVFDAGFDKPSGMPFLVMELLHGAELDKVVQTRGPLPPALVVSYFRQIASGLDRAHGYVTREGAANPIVHRDLKPENLFLAERESGEPMIKILDFGIAKVLTQSTNVSQEVKGTPLYMAFEQVAAGKITPQTDIWPLGLIAFFLLTGKAYWKAANVTESTITMLFGEVLSLPIEPASQRARELGVGHTLPPAFDAWFARCVEREPTRRFATAGECARALAQALALGTDATQASATAPVSQLGSSGAVAARTLGNTTATPLITESASTPARRRSGWKWALAIVAVGLAAGAVTLQRMNAPAPVASEAPVTPPSAPVAAATVTPAEPSPTPPPPTSPAPALPASASASVKATPAPVAGRPPAAAPARPAKTPPAPADAPAKTPTPKPAADVYGDR